MSRKGSIYTYFFLFSFFFEKELWEFKRTERNAVWLQHRGNKEDTDDEFEEIDRSQIMHDWSDHDKKFGFHYN